MYKEQIQAYWNDPARREEMITLTKRLVDIKSVKGDAEPNKPFGPGPDAALEEALRICEELGFKTENYDHYVGLADLNDMETELHVMGHLDVVAEGNDWDTDPYCCVEKDGLLLGRGVSDNKGPVVCAMLAMKAVRDLGLPLTKNVKLIMGTDEESGSQDIKYYFGKEPYAPCTFTPDADFPVINVERGHYHPKFGAAWEMSGALPRVSAMSGGIRHNVVPPDCTAEILGLFKDEVEAVFAETAKETGATFTITDTEDGCSVYSAGRNAHGAAPDDGLNAITALLNGLAKLPLAECSSTQSIHGLHTLFPFGDNRGQALGIAASDEETGTLTLSYATVILNENGFSGQFDVRFPLSSNEENCKAVCEANFAKHGIMVISDSEMTHVHCVPSSSDLVQTLLRCYSEYSGDPDPKPIAIGGGTYVHDIPGGVAFGANFPGFDTKMHSANEQASIENMLKSCQIFTQVIGELCR